MQLHSLQTPQGTWRYLASGQGKRALLFLHGASSSKRIWRQQYELSFEGYQCLFVDLLGYGESDQPDSGYSVENWMAGLHQLLGQQEVEEVLLIGHSNGVIWAKEYYRRHPEQVIRLIFLDGMLKNLLRPQVLEWMASALERPDYEAFMEQQIRKRPMHGVPEEDREPLLQDALNTPKQIQAAELEFISDPATWEPVQFGCPLTIIHAKNASWTQAYLEWLPSIAPQLTVHHWEDSGHFIPVQHGERLNQVIRAGVLTSSSNPTDLSNH